MTIQDFLTKAIEGGWVKYWYTNVDHSKQERVRLLADNCFAEILLDPLAWKALNNLSKLYE